MAGWLPSSTRQWFALLVCSGTRAIVGFHYHYDHAVRIRHISFLYPTLPYPFLSSKPGRLLRCIVCTEVRGSRIGEVDS